MPPNRPVLHKEALEFDRVHLGNTELQIMRRLIQSQRKLNLKLQSLAPEKRKADAGHFEEYDAKAISRPMRRFSR